MAVERLGAGQAHIAGLVTGQGSDLLPLRGGLAQDRLIAAEPRQFNPADADGVVNMVHHVFDRR